MRQSAGKPVTGQDTKTCTKCQQEKPISEFSFISRIGRWESWCFPCKRIYAKSYRERQKADPVLTERRKATLKRWRENLRADPERWAQVLEDQNRRRNKKWRDDPEYREHILAKNRHARARRAQDPNRRALYLEKQRLRNQEIKDIVFRQYGNCCACCGERCAAFLVIDHVDGSGSVHRKSRVTGVAFYRLIIKEGFPETYRILCCNCNWGRFVNGGTCPHQSPEPSEAISFESTPKQVEAPSVAIYHNGLVANDDMVQSAQ